ncbi:MAG TPA: tetratricopeptide repeat protein [Candidatus Acidoferrum sp.]|nr:tetratricopeptide repeat protein [Candidatus Acidoferrum sp.]
MASNSASSASSPALGWSPGQVGLLAAVCLALGLVGGYFLPAGKATNSPRLPAVASAPNAPHPMPTMEQMKALADAKAAPLLEKLKTTPNDAGLLAQVGSIFSSMHQFKEAARYYDKSLKLDPKNVPIRTELASSLYYSGDVDGALAQLEQALKYDPNDTNSLFNIGVIRWKGKKDAARAIAAWQQLLKVHPDLDRRAIVEKMIAEARTGGETKN